MSSRRGLQTPLHQTIARSSQTSSTHPHQALESKRSSRQPSSLSNSGNCIGFQEIINNYPAIWNQPWAGQQKVSPRLCSISATLCKCRKYQGGGTVGQSPPGCRAVSPSLALTSCQRPSSLDPSKGCFSQPCLQCRDRAAPNQELLPGLSPFPGHRLAFKVLKENHRQEQTPHSIILHFSSFYSFICTAIFYRTH